MGVLQPFVPLGNSGTVPRGQRLESPLVCLRGGGNCTVFLYTKKQRNKETKKQRNKETNKETKKQTKKQRNKETKKQRNKETKKQRNKETKKQRNKETKKQRNKETKKQRNKETNKQTNKQASKQASKQTNKQTKNKQKQHLVNKQQEQPCQHTTTARTATTITPPPTNVFHKGVRGSSNSTKGTTATSVLGSRPREKLTSTSIIYARGHEPSNHTGTIATT